MPVYDLLHVRCATVAQFDSVPIEDLMQFVTSWETFVNEVDERSSYICLNVSVEWWIKPYYISPPSLLVWSSLRCWVESEVVRIPALTQCFLVWGCSFVKSP